VRSSVVAILIFAASPAYADRLATVHSWSATAQTVSDAFCRGDVSADYLRETLAEARREIDRAYDELASERHERGADEAKTARDVIDRMTRRLRTNDREATCDAARELDVPKVAMR
jgi:alpha-glucuronidase